MPSRVKSVVTKIWWAGGTFSLWQGIPRHLGRNEQERGRYETIRAIDWATGCVVLISCAALREAGLFDEKIVARRLNEIELRELPATKDRID